jgi:hypothetical protein
VYGPNRDLVWLCVHAVTPTVVRLWPLVVRFLRDTLDDLADPSNPTLLWRLPAATAHPEYVIIRVPAGDPWLYIFAAAPNAISLTPDRITFLQDTLAELRTMAAERVDRRRRPLISTQNDHVMTAS